LVPESSNAFVGQSESAQPLVQKAIPSTGESIPVVGLGTAGSFSRAARDPNQHENLRKLLSTFVELGAKVIDTAPNYGQSEEILNRLLQELGLGDNVFLATKIAGVRGRDAGLAQAKESLDLAQTESMDLVQVHNLVDWKTQLPLLHKLKSQNLIRYVGVTTFRDDQYGDLETIMKSTSVDFVQVDYAINNRGIEDRILPLAADRGIAVIANMPFGAGRLFRAVAGVEVPNWLNLFGADTWAQFFIRWIISHQQITVTIPSTSKISHLQDNMAAGRGQMPTPDQRIEMYERFVAQTG